MKLLTVSFLGCLLLNSALANDKFFFKELVNRNILETDFSAIIKIKSLKKMSNILTDSGQVGYIKYQFNADVKQVIKGEAVDTIVYYDFYESGVSFEIDESLKIVSLCQLNNKFYIPGNGYLIPATKYLMQDLRQLKPLKQRNDACQ